MFARLSRERKLSISVNPYVEPPAPVVSRGIEAVRTYYEALYKDGPGAARREVKVAIVGRAGDGKTR